MNKQINISFAVLIILLLGSSFGMGAVSQGQNSVVIYSSEKNKAHSTHPFDQPNLFNINFLAESTGSLVSYISVPHSSGDERNETPDKRVFEAEIQKNKALRFQVFGVTDRPPTDLKFLFPYHTFL